MVKNYKYKNKTTAVSMETGGLIHWKGTFTCFYPCVKNTPKASQQRGLIFGRRKKGFGDKLKVSNSLKFLCVFRLFWLLFHKSGITDFNTLSTFLFSHFATHCSLLDSHDCS